VRCFVVAGFLLTSASRVPSAIAELLASFGGPILISGMAVAGFICQILYNGRLYQVLPMG